MQRIQAGDETGIAELYDRYAPTALALALRIVRDRTEAEDVVHDAFIAVVERSDQFHPQRGSVAAWLVTTGRNAALDRSRPPRPVPPPGGRGLCWARAQGAHARARPVAPAPPPRPNRRRGAAPRAAGAG